MIIYKCDRCNEEIEDIFLLEITYYNILRRAIDIRSSKNTYKSKLEYYLCKSCFDKVIESIDNIVKGIKEEER